MNITILQQSSINLQDSQILTLCQKLPKKTLILLGEYVLNPFFENLKSLPKDKIYKESKEKIAFLEDIAKKHSLSFIAPVVMKDSKGLIKQLAFIDGTNSQTNNQESTKNTQNPAKKSTQNKQTQKVQTTFYTQQRLISYDHWDEKKFFTNKNVALKEPLIFDYDGMRVCAMFGFEIHFDEIWLKIQKAGVDVVLLSCANTFDSYERWRELCKMRAFLNGCMVVRANRVGQCIVQGHKWEFYGDSLIAMPDGETIDSLGNQQEMLSIEITRDKIIELAKEYGFRKNY